MNGVDQMPEVAAEPVELPDDEGVTGAQRLQACRQARPVVAVARSQVLVEVLGATPAPVRASRCRSRTCDPSVFDTRM